MFLDTLGLSPHPSYGQSADCWDLHSESVDDFALGEWERDERKIGSRISCGATELLWQGGDEELGAIGGVFVAGAVAEELAGGGGGALLLEGGEVV